MFMNKDIFDFDSTLESICKSCLNFVRNKFLLDNVRNNLKKNFIAVS